MAATPVSFSSSKIPTLPSNLNPLFIEPHFPPSHSLSFATANSNKFGNRSSSRPTYLRKPCRNPTPPASAMIYPENPVVSDISATMLSGIVALSVLGVWQETAKRNLFDQVYYGVLSVKC